jgi:nucleoside-diphosphate-sugar epimerase
VLPHLRKPTTFPEVSPPSGVGGSDAAGVLVFGGGYLGSRVAESLAFSENRVWVTTRSSQKALQFSRRGWEPIVADWCDPSTLGGMPRAGRVLIAVSYDRSSSASRQDALLGGLANLLRVLSPTARVCYISTTGVYHQTSGEWVDETSPTEPTREGGVVHLQAEQCLNAAIPAERRTVLRLSGIYGPGRVPRAADVIAGRPIASHEEGFLNLIHVDDAVRAVIESWRQESHSLYLVSDDHPVRRGDFYREIARQTDAPEPQFITPPPDSSQASRSESNKRVRNVRMKSHLLPELCFPSYREGLSNVLSEPI